MRQAKTLPTGSRPGGRNGWFCIWGGPEPEIGMAGFAAGSASEPGVEMAGFDRASRRYLPTVSRLMSSSRAIRRWDQPCAAKVNIECCKLTLSSFIAPLCRPGCPNAMRPSKWLVFIRPFLAGFDRPLTRKEFIMKHKQSGAKIEITQDGPYLVSGDLPLSEQWIATNVEGESFDYREGKKFPAQKQYALCRCGESANKPFCDGTHQKVHFDGTETASHQPYLQQAEGSKAPRWCSPTRKICARSPGSAIRKAESGIWSSKRTIPKPDD